MSKPKNNKRWFNLAVNNENPESVDIHIYNDIGFWGTNAQDFHRELTAAGDVKNINLHINSNGGSLFDGFAIASQIKNSSAHVTAYIDGVAASSASLIAVAANKVVMSPFSFMMIHNPMTDLYSANADEMRKVADNLDNMTNGLINLYQSKTGKDEDEIKSLLDAETWMSGEQAIAEGFADELTEEIKVAACADYGKYSNHIPDEVAVKLDQEEETEAEPEAEEPQTDKKPVSDETEDQAPIEPEQVEPESIDPATEEIKNMRSRATGIITACINAKREDLIDAYQESELSAQEVEAALQEPIIVAPGISPENEMSRIKAIVALAKEASKTLNQTVDPGHYINKGFSIEQVRERIFNQAADEDEKSEVNTANRSNISDVPTDEALSQSEEARAKHEANVQALVSLARK